MKEHIKDIMKDIKKGKNLEKRLPVYTERFFQTYAQTAIIHLTMDYYMLYEILREEEYRDHSEIKEILGKINHVIKDVFVEENGLKADNIAVLESLRNDVIKKMKILTTYTDKLQIYEHVLNRIELRYEKNLVLSNQEQFIQKTMQYIFSSKDNVVTNNNIKEVVAELPVRMARSKYYQLIKNSFGLFKGADQSALDGFLYHLESAAMLYEPEEMKEHFLDLQEFLEELEQVDFQNLGETEFQELQERFLEYADFCVGLSDHYMGIQSIINHLYVYVLFLQFNQPVETVEMRACKDIIKAVRDLFEDNKQEVIPQEITDKLMDTEGIQEELAYDCEQLESVLYEIRTTREEVLKELQLEEKVNALHRMEQLMGSSLFVEFSEEDAEVPEEKVSEEKLEEVTKEFLNKIAELFQKNQKCVNRAIMSSTLVQLPNFFQTTDEVMEYVEYSMEQCTDAAERQASMNIISEIIQESM